MANAEDDINLERLETIGDSFLKYAVSTHLYWAFPDGDEGLLTRIRNTLISNKHLFHCGIEKKLGKILSGCIFKPDSTWLPPGFIYNEIMETRENNEVNFCSIIFPLHKPKLDNFFRQIRISLLPRNVQKVQLILTTRSRKSLTKA